MEPEILILNEFGEKNARITNRGDATIYYVYTNKTMVHLFTYDLTQIESILFRLCSSALDNV